MSPELHKRVSVLDMLGRLAVRIGLVESPEEEQERIVRTWGSKEARDRAIQRLMSDPNMPIEKLERVIEEGSPPEER